MSGSHLVVVAGNLAKDPEMRYTPAGIGMCKFTVPSEKVYMKDGEKVKETLWWNITVWGKQSEACNNYLTKGSVVQVTGTMKPRLYEKDGEWKCALDLNADHVQFLSGVRENTQTQEDSF